MDHEIKDQAREHEIELTSQPDGEYFDTSKEEPAKFEHVAPFYNVSGSDNKDTKAVEKINSLLKSGSSLKLNSKSKEKFDDAKNEEHIRSMFAPQMVIGNKNNGNTSSGNESLNSQYKVGGLNSTMSWGNEVSNWDNVYKHSGDGLTFDNTMAPVTNLWRDDNGAFDAEKWDQGNNWSQGLSAYANGKWNTDLYLKPSDWATLPQGSPTSDGPTVESITHTNTPTNTPTTTKPVTKSNFANTPVTTQPQTTQPQTTEPQQNKLCGAYDDLNLATDKSGNILIGNYTKAKKYFPGYTYIPPIYWDVPQRHTPVCAQPDLNVRKLTGLMDRGTPINALELNQDGSLADTEQSVSLTNVGSIMPKFNYYEVPFSQPYV
jgi:hypothetical protein